MPDLFPPDVRARLAPASGPTVPRPGRPPLPAALPVDEAIATFTLACEAVGGRVSRLADAADVVDLVAAYLEAPTPHADAGFERGATRGTSPAATYLPATGTTSPAATYLPAPRGTSPAATYLPVGAGLVRRATGVSAAAAFVAWDDEHIPIPGLSGMLRARGAEQLETSMAVEPDARAADLQRFDRAIVGITGAHAACVDTGSVALVHGAGRGRLVSLLPPVHVALVPVARIHASLGAWLAAAPEQFAASANVVVVTGPSRTADIEMTLTRGVHGPRIVHVVFVG